MVLYVWLPLHELQKVPPPLDFPELGSCALLQSFMKNELNSLLELTSERGG